MDLGLVDIMLHCYSKHMMNKKSSDYKLLKNGWILCPICNSKTRTRIRDDTELRKFPLYCPKCKKECLIDLHHLQITNIREPDAKTQSR